MKKKKQDKRLYCTVSIIAIVILVLWLLNLILLRKVDGRGTFGDMFGTVNSLFSGLAFTGIIFTILLQKKELSLQRQELIETRKEFQTQNKTLKLQRFENTFFQMINLHHRIVDDMDILLKTAVIHGRDVFRKRYKELRRSLVRLTTLDHLSTHYLNSYKDYRTDFGHYFRNLYRIIKMVDAMEFDHEESKDKYEIKYKYTSIVRAQLSDYELLWLFYNCLSINGNEKFKPLIEEYTLLKNLPEENLAKIEHKKFYKESAFIHKHKK